MRKQNGMSFLEIVISMTILLVVFFTTYQIFVTGLRYYKYSLNSTKLTKLAQEMLEDIALQRTPVAVSPAIPFPRDPNYRYSITLTPYAAAGVPYSTSPVTYSFTVVTLKASGPYDTSGAKGSQHQTVTLKTVIPPAQPFYPQKCGRDENHPSGASELIKE